jgi:hypothetical protein
MADAWLFSTRALPIYMTNIMLWKDVDRLNRGMEALMASSHENSPRSLWERIVLWTTAVAEAAEMDTFGYLDGRITHLERRIATLESTDRGAAKAKRD